jgi:hypothetical protein
MSQDKELTRYNPYKTPNHSSRRGDPRIAEAWTRAKTEAPNLYRKHEQMEAYFAAQQPLVDAVLDDPRQMAELEAIMQSVRGKQYITEYTLLGVESNATKRDVRNAYRRKARKLHPDAGGNEAAFKQLYTAYRRVLAVAKA